MWHNSLETIEDRHAILSLKYQQASAVLTTGFNGKGRNEAMIIGDHGSIRLHSPLYAPQALTMSTWPLSSGSSPEIRRIDKLLERADWINTIYKSVLPFSRVLLGRDRKKFRPFMGFGYQFEAQEVVNQLNRNKLESPITSWNDSIALARIIEIAKNK